MSGRHRMAGRINSADAGDNSADRDRADSNNHNNSNLNAAGDKSKQQGETISSQDDTQDPVILKERIRTLEREVASLRAQLMEAEIRESYSAPVFGVSLEKLHSTTGGGGGGGGGSGAASSPLPLSRLHYVYRVIGSYLRRDNGLLTQGLFRVPAGQDEVQHYKRVLDSGQALRFGKGEQLVAAGVLKQLLRELPEPLIPKLYDAQVPFLVEQQKSSADKSALINELKDVIRSLPPSHFLVLRALVGLLVEIAAHSKDNLMTVENLIKCIVPTVGCHPALFSYPMRHYSDFFGTEDAASRCSLADEDVSTTSEDPAVDAATSAPLMANRDSSPPPPAGTTVAVGATANSEKDTLSRDSPKGGRSDTSDDNTKKGGSKESKETKAKREKEEKERKEREEKERKERERREREEEKERREREKKEKKEEKEQHKKEPAKEDKETGKDKNHGAHAAVKKDEGKGKDSESKKSVKENKDKEPDSSSTPSKARKDDDKSKKDDDTKKGKGVEKEKEKEKEKGREKTKETENEKEKDTKKDERKDKEKEKDKEDKKSKK